MAVCNVASCWGGAETGKYQQNCDSLNLDFGNMYCSFD